MPLKWQTLRWTMTMTKAGDALADQGGKESSYGGESGKAKLSVSLRWAEAEAVSGTWMDLGSGVPGDLMGLNYAPGKLYLDRWDVGGVDVEGGAPKAMWFLQKSGRDPISWKGIAISLNGYVEEVSFTKLKGE